MNRLTRWLFADQLRALESATAAAAASKAEYDGRLREATQVAIDADEDQWRRLTEIADRDLPGMTQQRMQRLATYLWESNTLAERAIELPVAYLFAEGVPVVSDNEQIQEAIDAFWHDPVNRLDLNLEDYTRELLLFGEACWPAFVNQGNGAVRLGYLDPALIQDVVVDPDNPRLPVGVVTVRDTKGRYRRYKIIYNGAEEDLFTARTRTIRDSFADGEAFYFGIKRLLAGKRGRSLLLGQMDWLDGYDQYLFGEMDRATAERSILWDVTLKNATKEQVADFAKTVARPAPNSVRVHNDSVEWQVIAPQLSAADTAERARLLRNHVLGGGTIPTHWYGGVDDVNRASGESMQEPTLKVFSAYQRKVGAIVVELCKYAVGHALGKPVDWSDPDNEIRVDWPELTARDISRYAAAVGQVAIGCAAAADKGWMTDATAVSLIAQVSARLGVDINAAEELKSAQAEMTARREEDAFRDPPDPDDVQAAGDTPANPPPQAGGGPNTDGNAEPGGNAVATGATRRQPREQ